MIRGHRLPNAVPDAPREDGWRGRRVGVGDGLGGAGHVGAGHVGGVGRDRVGLWRTGGGAREHSVLYSPDAF